MGVDDLLPAAGTGDLRPRAGVGAPCSVLAGGGSTSDPDVSLASPSVTVTVSSSSEKSSSTSEESSSSVDSGMAGHGLPSVSAILHSFSCFSFLSLS